MSDELIPQETGEAGIRQAACSIATTWGVSLELATRLVRLAGFVPFPLYIISGYRTADQELELAAAGRPAIAPELSTHTTCPATGADLRVGAGIVTQSHKVALGTGATRAGLRWGGGSQPDENGIPSDWNHVDLGPRMDAEAQAYRQQHP